MLLTVAGLALAIWTFGATGIRDIASAASAIGPLGFLLFCLWSAGIFVPLGAAWLVAAPGEPATRLWLFSWARAVREAVADLLPFSQLGGIVVASRLLDQHKVPRRRLYGAMVVDMTTELAAQLVFTLLGLWMMAALLVGHGAAVALRPAILGGTGVMVGIILLFFSLQRPALALASRIAGHMLPDAGLIDDIRAELADIYGRRWRVLFSFLANLAAWFATAGAAWLLLRLMGHTTGFWNVVALESLIFTLRSVAFFIPGALGIQEAAYAVAGPLFGLPPNIALAISLIKRARDLTLGLPTLVAWQLSETRALIGRRRGARLDGAS